MKKISGIITLITLFVLSTYALADNPKWYEGGNLHKATVRVWNNSSYKNRLATSADWFNEITKKNNAGLKKKLDNLNNDHWLVAIKAFSGQLEECISGIAIDERLVNPDDKIAEVAATCYISMYMN